MSELEQDDEVLVGLLTEHQLPLRLYVQSLMPGDERAKDVAQQANATLWRKRRDFEIGTNFKAWAFAIARFEVLNFRKSQARDARRLVFGADLDLIMTEELVERNPHLESRQNALRLCLKALKERDRILIEHRYIRQTPLKQISKEMDRSVGGLKVTLHRLRSRLQKCIQRRIQEGTPA